VAAALVLTLTACTGGGGGKDGADGPSLPLPDKAPSARGPAMGPALEPKVLLESTDELEESLGSNDMSIVERRAGAFVSGKTVVGYSIDNISGYDLASGELKWTAELDLGGGTLCFVSEPDRPVKTFTVAYGDSSYCPDVATIRVSDGKVMKKSTALSDMNEFEGERAGGTVNHLFTVKGRDYLVDMSGVVWKMVKGVPKPVARLEVDSYFGLHPTPKGDMLIGSSNSGDDCRVDAYALPSFEHAWTQKNAVLFPEATQDCVISVAPGNSAWLAQQIGNVQHMVQVDPATGDVLGRDDAPTLSGGQLPEGEFDLSSATNQLEQAMGLPGGDTIFAQVRGLTRYSLETGKVAWDLDLGQFELASDDEFALTTVLPQGITADGYVVASVSNNTAVELVAVDAKTGKLAGRWAVPEEFRNGFQVQPGMTLFGGGVVLSRNFREWGYAFRGDFQPPDGPRYDFGVFTFPKADDSAVAGPAVPTAGPVDTEAKALGGLKTPDDAEGDRNAGAISTGSRVVAHVDNALTGLDPKSGKRAWKTELDPKDPGARVCSVAEPDRTVKTVTVSYRGTGEDARCDTLLRLKASDGTVMDRIEVPAAAKSVWALEVHRGVVHVITGDRKVSRIKDGKLVEHAALARTPYEIARTPEDPSLMIITSNVDDGRDWAIDGYRLPSFDPVWSTTGTKVFSKVDRRNSVSPWRGNGLWMSTSFGDPSAPGGKVEDALALLDPKTGEVVTRVGPVERDYLADDLTVFTLGGAITASYDTAGFENGDVVLPQAAGLMRYSLAEEKIRWTVDTTSIKESMERDRLASYVSEDIHVVDGGKTVLVTLSNGISVEVMTLKATNGKITGRWVVPAKHRNGLQADPAAVPFAGGVALVRSDYSWDYVYRQNGREVPPEQLYDVGLFRLPKPGK
jgi:outer membrane protein assembly factor BamB